MKISLKVKLMTTFLILILVPVSVLGIVSYNMSSSSLQSSTKSQLQQQANDVSSLIEKSIDSVKGDVQIASLNTQITDLIEDRSSQNIDKAYDYIKSVQSSNKEFMEELIITDVTGRVIIDTDTKTPDIDLGDRDYMKEMFSTGDTSVSEVLTSRFTGNPAIFIACPVRKGDAIVGTVVGSIKFSSISTYASDVKIGESGYGYLVDKNGLIVGHPNEDKILKENISDNEDTDLKNIVKEMKDGKTSDGFYEYEGMKKYITFRPADKWVVAVTAEYNEYMASALSIRRVTIICIVIFILISMAYSYFYSTKEIINPIKTLQKLMKSAGDGDLTVQAHISNKDEIGQLAESFNDMIKNQEDIIKNVTSASEQLDEAAEHLASSSEEISATTEEISTTMNNVSESCNSQNLSILDISEVLVQLASLVKLAENRTQSTDLSAKESNKAADVGREKVQKAVQAMKSIKNESSEASQVLHKVNDLSAKAGGIVNTINDVAEEINLLALNAAIEAARAGENGKGFSVVAEEIRKLSEETNSKAGEIAELISEMISQTANAVSAMERANVKVEDGVTVVNETDETFVNIIKSIEVMVKNIAEILDITSDEVASSDRIVSLINEVATATEDNSANCENVSNSVKEEASAIESLTATAEETNAMSDQLLKLVEKFKV